MSGVRCFVGIPLPADMRRALVLASDAIRSQDAAWRNEKWVAESNLHVTLVFIGSIAENRVPALCDAVAEAVNSSSVFELVRSGIRAVPGARRCRMMWAAFDDPDLGCTALADALVEATVPFGAEHPEREFRAHATLVRARRPRPAGEGALAAANALLGGLPTSMSVRSATLFASTLTPAGPVYEELGAWELLGR